jgi:hypothetical protein
MPLLFRFLLSFSLLIAVLVLPVHAAPPSEAVASPENADAPADKPEGSAAPVEEPEEENGHASASENLRPDPDEENAQQGETPALPVNTDTLGDTIRFLVLNKVTAKAETIEASVGSVTRAGTIEIIAHSCHASITPTGPENAAFLEISEVRQAETPRRIFLGWMFSSSPSLSSLESPTYDVSVIECLKKQP